MLNNINSINTNKNFQSILHKKIYLKYHPKNEITKNNDIQYIKFLIQTYINKNITNLIELNHIWLCIKIIAIDDKENNQNNIDETNDSQDNLIKLFNLPQNLSDQIEIYLKQYDRYIEKVNENKDEYLIDLTSYGINNYQENLDDEKNIFLFLHKLKIEIEQKFNINIFIGKANNILLASLACLKCFVESTKNKNNESIIINDINDLFEENDNNDYLISVKNDEKSILDFMNKYPLEYLTMSDNKYFENFLNKKINEKNFPNIKNLGDIINIHYEEIFNIFNEDDIYKDIFLFCLGIGEIYHKTQIINNNGEDNNEIKERSFKNKNKSQLIEIYKKLAEELFKQIYFYQYNARKLIIIIKDNKKKLYRRVLNNEYLFNNIDSLINIGIKAINNICLGMSENDIKCFIYMKIYFDNIVKFDTINREIWEKIYNNEITEIRIKNNKIKYWHHFLNSKSKDDKKNISKSVDNNSKNSKNNLISKKNSISSKTIKDLNNFKIKGNLDLLKLNKKRKKLSKGRQYLLLAKNKKMENFGVVSKEIKK